MEKHLFLTLSKQSTGITEKPCPFQTEEEQGFRYRTYTFSYRKAHGVATFLSMLSLKSQIRCLEKKDGGHISEHALFKVTVHMF